MDGFKGYSGLSEVSGVNYQKTGQKTRWHFIVLSILILKSSTTAILKKYRVIN